jgi:hypothetical protein
MSLAARNNFTGRFRNSATAALLLAVDTCAAPVTLGRYAPATAGACRPEWLYFEKSCQYCPDSKWIPDLRSPLKEVKPVELGLDLA